MKATGSVETARAGRKRVYENVGFVLQGQARLRVEVYGPLGQSLTSLVWNGKDIAVRLEDGRIVRPGQAGLEKILGMPMDAAELSAILSANLPSGDESSAAAYREPDGRILVQTFLAGTERLVHVVFPEEVDKQGIWIEDIEVRRSGKLAFRVRYSEKQIVSGYAVPKSVLIEDRKSNLRLPLHSTNTEVNIPLNEEVFVLSLRDSATP